MSKKSINIGAVKKRRKDDIWEKLSSEDRQKVKKLRTLIKIHFKNQSKAAEKLEVNQCTISRYLSGEIPISESAAQVLIDLSEGTVKLDELIR